ncbi:hypothetical protein [Kineosporia sp. R_H_3]|uniref:hypothetical protein n=1 Tax=Kineosporia sp. R_H_3 TaxID=1961848 RepID=UPI00117A24AC|nr:hypothetical protein [Kineosporia sp. R_H_3]
MQNFLKDIVSARTRQQVYAAYSLVGLTLGCVQAGLGAIDSGTPDWLKASLAVYAFFGTAIGVTAASNVNPPPEQ